MIHLAAALLAANGPAMACPRVPLTPMLRRTEAARIATAAHATVRPAMVGYILAQGPWRLVWATPENMERGVYFFRGGRLIDTWGGILGPDERRDGVSWARQAPRNLPAALAGCFADAIIAGR